MLIVNCEFLHRLMGNQAKLIVVTPVYNDWIAFEFLIDELSAFSLELGLPIHLIAIDDCSTTSYCSSRPPESNSIDIELIKLGTNLGHQRAIAIGLCQAYSHANFSGVVVMDSDGEDSARDIGQLVRSSSGQPIIVAARKTRSESINFKIFYQIYRLMFVILTGRKIDFGNYMYIPASRLEPLVYMPELWNHLAASILKSKLPVEKVSIARAKRFFGSSKMNFNNLVLHGLGAMSVFTDLIFSRILFFLLIVVICLGLLIALVLYLKFWTAFAIPGWATMSAGFLALGIMQSIFVILISVFTILSSRAMNQFVPLHDSRKFVSANLMYPISKKH